MTTTGDAGEILRTVTEANIAGTLSERAARLDYKRAAAGADVLVVCEDQARAAAGYVDGRLFDTFQGPHGPRARVSIHWRRNAFRESRAGVVLLHASRLFPSATRWCAFVLLVDLVARRRLLVVGVHLVPHADDPAGGVTRFPRRRLVLVALAVLVALVNRFPRCQVVMAGDFNIERRRDELHHDPTDALETLAGAGLLPVELGATHGPERLDWFLVRLTRGARVVRAWVHKKGRSDHRAASVVLGLRIRRHTLRRSVKK